MIQAQAVLSRYGKDPSTIRLLDYPGMLFSVQSISIVTVWYTVSIQRNYCNCPDEATNCKHIIGVILVIERHIPELSVSLPIIRHAFEMHSEMPNIGLQEEHHIEVNNLQAWLRLSQLWSMHCPTLRVVCKLSGLLDSCKCKTLYAKGWV
jgi:hypothetical protein